MCCRLKPDHVPYFVILLERLQAWKRWDEAADEAVRIFARFPDEPMVRFYVAWGKVQLVVNNRAPKHALHEARELFESILGSKQLTAMQNVCVACSLYLCLARVGEHREAERVLRRTIREWPSPSSDLAWELLCLAAAQRERRVLERVPQLLAA
jgi:hypothetical protein